MTLHFDIEPLTESEEKFTRKLFESQVINIAREIALSRDYGQNVSKRQQVVKLVRMSLAEYLK